MTTGYSTATLESGLAQIFNSVTADMHTCLPAQVTAFDAAAQTVSVQPCLNRLYEGDESTTQLPVIEDVPVVFPGAASLWLTFDVPVDSYVMLIFSERAITTWLATGGVDVDPVSNRKFDLTDAFAVPGIYPTADVLDPGVTEDAMELRLADGTASIKMDTDGVITLTNAGGSVSIAADGAITVATDGAVDINGHLAVAAQS